MTLKLTPDQLKEILLEALNLPNDTIVNFLLGETWEGYGMGEHKVWSFEGVELTYKTPLEIKKVTL